MFNKLKQFKELRDQAKSMQNMLAQERVAVEKNGVEVTVSGNMEILEVKINEELKKESLENAIKDASNEALKKVQKIMAAKMKEMGGFPGLG